MLSGDKLPKFTAIIQRNVPLSRAAVAGIVSELQSKVVSSSSHGLHAYTMKALDLKNILIRKMNVLTSREFEQVYCRLITR
jgi:hypothetical protein